MEYKQPKIWSFALVYCVHIDQMNSLMWNKDFLHKAFKHYTFYTFRYDS